MNIKHKSDISICPDVWNALTFDITVEWGQIPMKDVVHINLP